ncbi:hypothetical protein P280DRAFT_466196 [Massarina eburnea CBS 473.64]|uniref:Uncharacterized protein n=1 Tax=Massarina eburnea CBS 473.64 TaxID=1395130 RepID=A0A6A6SDK2_9PLEO|nr:hypothetical protein P280DRAFT_466196 [Massarina eburnea CBS 473.64]
MDSLMLSTETSRPTTPKLYSAASSSASQGPSDLSNMSKPVSPSQTKFTSPAPPTTFSMTPPPSSQIPNARILARTPTPPTPQLSSPPLTSKLPNQPPALPESAAALFTQDEISNASADELRSMVNEVTSALRDMRLSAAHYKLQYSMSVMESQEAASRMAVELAMAQREIDVLQQAEEKRRNPAVPEPIYQESSTNAANAIMMSEMNRQIQMLQGENEELRDITDQQKRLTEHREGELASMVEENDRLKARIRKNREHMAQYLPYMEQMGESPRSTFGTPYTPRHKAARVGPLPNENSRGQNNFEALLLADKMLSQETATAPSTPTRSHAPRSRFGHHRGAQSMSSLPQTPNRRSHLQANVLRTPPPFAAVNIPQSAPPAHYERKPAHGRRESSNSTITASSLDEEEAFTDREDDEVQESQASQMATSMLRRAPPPRKMTAPSSQPSNLIQSKIFGQVKKGYSLAKSGEPEKRRLQSGEQQGSPPKRGRMGVGLGIGGLRD